MYIEFLCWFVQAESSKSAGSGWFDMPAPQLTAELKNDLRLLKMRGALDPARHYKKTHSNSLPRYFQVRGRIDKHVIILG